MLDLYVLNDCPYCKKVMEYLRCNNISFMKYNIENDDNVLRLLTIGGKEQVPFLHDSAKDIKMYESEDIINYVENTYVKGCNDAK